MATIRKTCLVVDRDYNIEFILGGLSIAIRNLMDAQLATLFVLTFAINLIGTLAYAARIAGVRTRRIALAFSLFNALVLISRTANSFQAPLLAKRVESKVLAGATTGALADFRWLLFAASLATVVGALLTPTTQRLFSRAVSALTRRRSL